MTTTKQNKSYAPSINLERDLGKDLNYIPTPNGRIVFNQLINNFRKGTHCFNIIGAYGSGKSAFVCALERVLNGHKGYFEYNKSLFAPSQFEFLPIVGSYESIIKVFTEKFKLGKKEEIKTKDVINAIQSHYFNLERQGKGLVLVIDEFGKLLEYAAKHDPERELYFIQELAEFINDHDKNAILITTLHQDFSAYAFNLTKSQKQEWDKVKGRLKELTFNEPVEQLLYLASERINDKYPTKRAPKNFKDLYQQIESANAFPLNDYFNYDTAKKLIPFDLLSASILTLSLQKYGQNERSLFSFIDSGDINSLNDFDRDLNPYYNLSCVYDYLIHNYYSLLATKYNPDYAQWSAIRHALDKAEGVFEEEFEEAAKIIKSVGLMNLFVSNKATIDKPFLTTYALFSLDIDQPSEIIDKLESRKIIRFQKHNQRYIPFEGTDLDIELAIDEAGNLVEKVNNVSLHLRKYFDFPYVPAKQISYEKGTPRFFAFILSESPEDPKPEGEIDGYVNLIFSDEVNIQDVKKESAKNQLPILYGLYSNTSEIRNLIYEIEKAKKVRENNINDRVAVRELNSIIDHSISLLNHYVMGSIYSKSSAISWCFKGDDVEIDSYSSFNRTLSTICRTVYHKCPIFRNEMVNKTKISGAISTARKKLTTALLENAHLEALGFPSDKFPPEKSIYLTLLKSEGFHKQEGKNWGLVGPNKDSSFKELWNYCNHFLDSSKSNKRRLSELVEDLYKPPFKLKAGFIDFWITSFLVIKKNDFALYGRHGYIPDLTKEVMDLIIKKPKDFSVKAFNVSGIDLEIFNNYRAMLDQTESSDISNAKFIETIKPFLTLYKQLTPYAKSTKDLPSTAIKLRDIISSAQDPEQVFFEDFPNALGYTKKELEEDKKAVKNFIYELQSNIKLINHAYQNLVDRVEEFIAGMISGDENAEFPSYKERLQSRYKFIKEHMLKGQQKVFYTAIYSKLDDKYSWLNSLAQSIMSKQLSSFSDDDESVFYDEFVWKLQELDNLVDLGQAQGINPDDEVMRVEISSLSKGTEMDTISYPKEKSYEIQSIKHALDKVLDEFDKNLSVYALAELLKQKLHHDEES